MTRQCNESLSSLPHPSRSQDRTMGEGRGRTTNRTEAQIPHSAVQTCLNTAGIAATWRSWGRKRPSKIESPPETKAKAENEWKTSRLEEWIRMTASGTDWRQNKFEADELAREGVNQTGKGEKIEFALKWEVMKDRNAKRKNTWINVAMNLPNLPEGQRLKKGKDVAEQQIQGTEMYHQFKKYQQVPWPSSSCSASSFSASPSPPSPPFILITQE